MSVITLQTPQKDRKVEKELAIYLKKIATLKKCHF